jgi:hypothetical protein
VPLLIDMPVERDLCGSRGVGRDHGRRARGCDGGSEMVCVVGGVGEDEARREALNQRARLRRVPGLAGGEQEPRRTAEAADRQMDLCAQAASRASDRLILSPPFAPAAC